MAKPPLIFNGQLVSPYELPELLAAVREQRGLSAEQLASDAGVTPETVEEAESQPYRCRLRLRKRLLEQLTGYTLDGPFYRLTKRD